MKQITNKKTRWGFSQSILSLCFVILSPQAISNKQVTEQVSEQAPINLRADSSRLNGKTGLFEHCGNAQLTQLNISIKADCINGKRRDDGGYDFIAASGSANLIQYDAEKKEKLDIKGELIEYKVQQKQFRIAKAADLKLSNEQKDSVQILAESINLDNRNEQSRLITAKGSPLKIVLARLGTVDLEAVSKQLTYNTGSSQLKLAEDVIANLEVGQISAGLFEYNSNTKESSFTRSSDQQVEIIQQEKQP